MRKFIQFGISLTIIGLIISFPIYLFSDSAENIAEKFSLLDFYNRGYRTTIDSKYDIKKRKEYFDEVRDNVKRIDGIDISDPILKIVKKSDHIKFISFRLLKVTGDVEIYGIEYKFKDSDSEESKYIYIAAADKKFWDAKTAKFMYAGIAGEGYDRHDVSFVGEYLKSKIYRVKSYK